MKVNKIVIILIIIIASFSSYYLMQSRKVTKPTKENDKTSGSNELKPVDTITHGHGLAVDVADPTVIYIATHHGLLLLKNDKDLYQVGDKKDDYMGFSTHPTDPKIFFSSGHPEIGGNMGFQKSEDGGFSWKKVSDGVNGPVDFHAMTVSPANPNLIYGWYQGAVQRSIDRGTHWEIVSKTNIPFINLVADPQDENILYAGSPQGLMMSKNRGKDWDKLIDGFVSTIAVNPQDSQKLLSYSEKKQLAKSSDRGQTWKKITVNLSGETPLFISYSLQDTEMVYFLTEKNSLYKSIDSGNSWDKIR